MAPKGATKNTGRKKSKDMKRLILPVPKGYTSPLKKRREKLKTMTERAITTAQELRTYAKASKDPNEIVVIYGLFLWGSYHTTERGRNIAHLHLYDAVADDSLADLLENYKYEGDRHFDTDKELMTATVWDVVEENKGLPSPGDIVRIAHFTGLSVFREEASQFNTKLADVRVAQHATTIDHQTAVDEDEEKSTIVIT